MAASFWESMGPGLLGLGADIYGEQREARKTRQLLDQARGPLYGKTQALAGRSLDLAQNMDPKAMAAERFAAQQSLVAPGEEAQRQDLMRQLQAQGLLGVASHGAVPGVVTTPGQPVNPYFASLLAAQQTARQKSAYESLNEGERYLDQLINRAGTVQGQAQGAQQSGINAVRANLMQNRPKPIDTLLKVGTKILKDPAARSQIPGLVRQVPGMLQGAGNWLSSLFEPSARSYAPEDYYPAGRSYAEEDYYG